MPTELLRKSVVIDSTKDGIQFSHPSWSISVSDKHLNSTDESNLRNELLNPSISPNLELTKFFSDQHLHDYSYLSNRVNVTSDTLIEVCRTCANEWFGVLYSHPWWVELAHDRNDAIFRDWVMQNYGLSKIAAISSAIAANEHLKLKPFFISSILEEYDHHKVFFNVRNENLAIGADFYARETTLGINGLKAHLTHLAKTDILGLLIFYYFQECSAYLVKDFRTYYSHLESLYGIESFFDGWLSHVDVDDELNHGREVEVAIEQYGPVSPSHLLNSLENAWLAVALLLSDYDDFSALHPKDMAENLQAGEIEKIALSGLSLATESQRILEFGSLLKLSQVEGVKGYSEYDGDRWREKAIKVLSQLFGQGALSIGDVAQSGRVTSSSCRLLHSLLVRRPPNLFSGGAYYTPQSNHECSS